MRLCRIVHESLEGPRYAVLVDTAVIPLSADYNFGKIEMMTGHAGLALDEVKLIAPVAPSKVVCVGRNYREHAAELGNKMPDEPLLFLKAPSAVIAAEDRIELPAEDHVEHHHGVIVRGIARGADVPDAQLRLR